MGCDARLRIEYRVRLVIFVERCGALYHAPILRLSASTSASIRSWLMVMRYSLSLGLSQQRMLAQASRWLVQRRDGMRYRHAPTYLCPELAPLLQSTSLCWSGTRLRRRSLGMHSASTGGSLAKTQGLPYRRGPSAQPLPTRLS